MRTFRISDYSTEEQRAAKLFISKAFLGYLTSQADRLSDDLLFQVENISFLPEDSFTVTHNFTTSGADILAALGAARNEKEKRRHPAKKGDRRVRARNRRKAVRTSKA